jgi:hypothetical protein
VRRLFFILTACLCADVATAQMKVFSPRAEATSITIYRDGLALVTETRNVELPAEPVTLVFQGVVDTLLQQSAVMTGAERPLAETDFSFDRLTPATLIQRSIGKTVTLIRTNKQTGRVTRLVATVASAGEGVVLRAVDGSEALRCSGMPEHLEFSEVPAELNTTPVLSVRLAGGTPGKRTVALSYLAHGFSWSSDYVARLNDAANRLDLTGWVTLENRSNSSFSQAQVQVVAGTLNLISDGQGGSRPGYADAISRDYQAEHQVALLAGCYPLRTTTMGLPTGEMSARERRLLRDRSSEQYFAATPIAMLEEVMMTGSRAVRENLGDYQLYRLPWPTDLNARQTKQAVFLSKPGVKVERFYSVRLYNFDAVEASETGAPNLMLRWENKESEGLGEPLPAGAFRVFEPYADGEVFAGEAQIQDRPVGLPIEIAIARAMNLTSDYTIASREADGWRGRTKITIQVLHHFVNNKDAAVSVEVRHAGDSGYSSPVVVKSNLRAGKKYGDLAWRFRIPAGGEESLRYELRSTVLE